MSFLAVVSVCVASLVTGFAAGHRVGRHRRRTRTAVRGRAADRPLVR